MNQPATATKRFAYLDFLRILAAFLVIVNHTNSLVFEKTAPSDPVWWLSVAWYYLSKIAVPLFVMVSGACLLPRQETYRKTWGRFLRVLLVLVIFSYAYYLVGVWETYWTWARAFDYQTFFASMWAGPVTDSFWYLYFYLGMMVMLPILQRMAAAMQKRDVQYLMGVSFFVYAGWPLVTHYLPGLAFPPYFDVPVFAVFIGLFFAGHYVHAYAARPGKMLNLLIALAMVAASVWLTYLEFGHVAQGAKYWFMDERTEPSLPVIVCAIAVMALARSAFEAGEARLGATRANRWAVVGGCAFGIYLLQDLVIAETRYRFFVPVSGVINPFLAALIWEIGVFLIAFGIAWVLKHIPLLRKLL
ncbi:MAG TPA: acyltransferase family protein [Candidatus Limiplasma sp.]|nr:acyltransferase family protein [Candidatus Limiplasma sp.]